MNIWEMMYERFQFKKDKITLFESFSGIGSQFFAFEKDVEGLGSLQQQFGFEIECVGISEIDKYAIAAYKAMYGEVKNYGSICDIQEIPQVDIFTYSFPCQDISLAGRQKGFDRGDNTRSGLLWEVERLLDNQHAIGKLPKVLLMENVKALVSNTFKDNFVEWQLKLQSLGYTNYWEVLNAKDYGIPQNRERVFMVSVLGEYAYTFPKPFELKLRLKDMLEDEVDEKYYLSDKAIAKIKRALNTNIVKKDQHVISTIISQYYKIPRDAPYILDDNGLRKLTCLETHRLMGFTDTTHQARKDAGISDTQCYKQDGNSIVVDVLYYIFKELF